MTDRELIDELLGVDITDREREAFTEMAEHLDEGDPRGLSKKQHEWVRACGVAHNIVVDEALNMYSAGLVPKGVATPKSKGEQAAADLLAKPLPKLPPGRRTA